MEKPLTQSLIELAQTLIPYADTTPSSCASYLLLLRHWITQDFLVTDSQFSNLKKSLSPCSPTIEQALDWTRNSTRSHKTFLYRQYLIRNAFQGEIGLGIQSKIPAYILTSLVGGGGVFSQLSFSNNMWIDLLVSPTPLKLYEVWSHALPGMLEAEVHIADVRDGNPVGIHARLSSFALLYLLHFIRCTMGYEAAVRSDPPTQALYTTLQRAITQIQGIITNV